MGANEKHDATYHGGEYTSTTEAIRDQFIDRRGEPGNESWNEGAALRFDRWLETVRAEAKAEALHEVLTVISAEIEDAPPANYEEDNYEAGYIAGLDFLLNAKALDNQHKENQS